MGKKYSECGGILLTKKEALFIKKALVYNLKGTDSEEDLDTICGLVCGLNNLIQDCESKEQKAGDGYDH